MTNLESTLKERKPVLDFDSVVYSSAFLGQEGYGPDAKPLPVSHALQIVKFTCTRVLYNVFDAKNTGYSMYLGGTGNFRNDIATIKPYKGNRPAKPIHYQAVRDYLIEYWGAELVDGMEAEDKASIEYLKDPENRCLVHIDKDLDQVPGLHYNWKTDGGISYTISKADANLNFWTQVLTGDPTDSIVGLPGIGKQKAIPILSGIGDDYEEGKRRVEKAYKDTLGSQKWTYHPDDTRNKYHKEDGPPYGMERHDGTIIDWHDALVETGKLIYILRTEDEAKAVINIKEDDDGKDTVVG